MRRSSYYRKRTLFFPAQPASVCLCAVAVLTLSAPVLLASYNWIVARLLLEVWICLRNVIIKMFLIQFVVRRPSSSCLSVRVGSLAHARATITHPTRATLATKFYLHCDVNRHFSPCPSRNQVLSFCVEKFLLPHEELMLEESILTLPSCLKHHFLDS